MQVLPSTPFISATIFLLCLFALPILFLVENANAVDVKNQRKRNQLEQIKKGMLELRKLCGRREGHLSKHQVLDDIVECVIELRNEMKTWKEKDVKMQCIREEFFAYLKRLHELGIGYALMAFDESKLFPPQATEVEKYLEKGPDDLSANAESSTGAKNVEYLGKHAKQLKYKERIRKSYAALRALTPAFIFKKSYKRKTGTSPLFLPTIVAAIEYIEKLKILRSEHEKAEKKYAELLFAFKQCIDKLEVVCKQTGIPLPIPPSLQLSVSQSPRQEIPSNMVALLENDPSAAASSSAQQKPNLSRGNVELKLTSSQPGTMEMGNGSMEVGAAGHRTVADLDFLDSQIWDDVDMWNYFNDM